MKKLIGLILLTFILAGCVSSAGTTKTENKTDKPVLTASKVSEAVSIDGKISEGAWKKAKATKVKLNPEPGAQPKEITLRALYDWENIYISASYADATPLKIGEAWTYDGGTWTKGAYDDTLAFLWNTDDSLPGFDERAFGVMTAPLKKGMDVFDFRIDNPSSEMLHARADFWGWCGLPEFYGRGDDMIFKASTKPGENALVIGHDAYTNATPWIKNETIVGGKAAPMYKYKDGLTLETTPRPYMEDVELITDYSSFKPGDHAPFVIGVKDAVWGGSKDDIITKGQSDGAIWTVEFARQIETGYPDDIKLVRGQDAVFAVIVRDDGKGYALSGPVVFRFE